MWIPGWLGMSMSNWLVIMCYAAAPDPDTAGHHPHDGQLAGGGDGAAGLCSHIAQR